VTRIVDGAAENVDLIAEWKIVDAQWYEIFAKAGLEKVFRVFLKLDADHEEGAGVGQGVRAVVASRGAFGKL
jgi:hypothetical protein